MKHSWFLALVVLLAASCAATPEPSTTTGSGAATATSNPAIVFLVRHAEKVDSTDASPLTEQGTRRADRLAALLADAGIQSIWSSDFTRTRDTAAPLAQRLGIEVEVYDHHELAILSEALIERGGRHLVVGHTNTTTEMVRRLGGAAEGDIPSADYTRLYVVVRAEGASPNTLLLRFEPTP